MWVKKSFAQSTPGFGTAKHLLVLYAQGGLRSAPLFNAEAAFQHNPFGKMNSTAEWSVGKVLGEQRIPLFSFGEQLELPTVAEIAGDVAVLAGVDHEPRTDRAVLDHDAGDYGVCTGHIDMADAGLLARIHKDHPGYVNGSLHLPPIDIGLSRFGRGEGDYTGYRPIAIQSAENFRGRSEGEARETTSWARDLRLARDDRFIGKRAPYAQPYLGAIRDAKINAREYSQALRNSALDLLEVPEAELGGVTNQQILEVLGGGPFGGQWGLETGFALRMMQLGVPAMAVTRYLTEGGIPIFDTHSDEKTTLPIDAADLGRQISGLRFLMKRMRDDEGNFLWDSTVVVVMSEFSRDNTDPSTGFNTGNGSDHQGGIASRNQIWPIFGGPIKAGGKKIGGLNPNTLEVADGKRIATVRSVHATLLALLGIDSTRHFADPPIAELMT
jgi:hypothetical protein